MNALDAQPAVSVTLERIDPLKIEWFPRLPSTTGGLF